MTHPCYANRSRWLRPMGSLLCIFLGCSSVPSALVQDLDKPLQTIDEDITSFAFAPDNRIVYSVHRNFKTKLYDLLHDVLWLQQTSGKRRRLLGGQKFNCGTPPFCYIVDSLRRSPNAHLTLA